MQALSELGYLVKSLREHKGLSQQEVAATVGTNRSVIAHLEQGLRIPKAEILEKICDAIGVPEPFWKAVTSEDSTRRIEFESALGELVGRPLSVRMLDASAIEAAEEQINQLVRGDFTSDQALATLNRVLVYYDVPRMTSAFFKKYLNPDTFRTIDKFRESIKNYQRDAIRLFPTFKQAYETLNSSENLADMLAPLGTRTDEAYRGRTEWRSIETIPEERLADLGYISIARVEKERAEMLALADFLKDLAKKIRDSKKGADVVSKISEKRRRHFDSLMRKFEVKIAHDLSSSLFPIDPDLLEREAERLSPKDNDLARIKQTQSIAARNLANYLTADFMDVYVATSMRSDADFVSVNRFVAGLFSHPEVRPLKLRYFDPTQSSIDDRVAKGLVEALMLKRANFTIYMAQKEDTFGKDSEASVALGQGKSVIVYVPKLVVPQVELDSENLGRKSQKELKGLVEAEGKAEDKDFDDTVDHDALMARLLTIQLGKLDHVALAEAIVRHWADFDLYGAAERIADEKARGEYRKVLDAVIKSGTKDKAQVESIKGNLIPILISNSMLFERRAKIFRAIHPLALQVILSTGVLNGILVARSVDSCAKLLKALVANDLDLDLDTDDQNYRLVERSTNSTIRVISRHELIANAFGHFYETEIGRVK